ncbi:MAG: DegT/DnrJ/EryC1/StrS family aminotransferase [Candidatus Nitrosopelagicus sp.]|nr:DegT/DnrJ/EryC1/StrS family aminotransferase [Candidatus Nitrosopelagicus sp.]
MTKEFKVPMSQPAFDTETQEYMFDVIKSGWWSQGKITELFEKNLSEYFPSNVVAVNNGTSAITAALMAHGIKNGDKVVVPDYTFIATSSAAKIIGAEVLVADVNPKTLNVKPESIEQLVKQHDVKAVIVVPMAGLPVDLDPIIELSKRYEFVLIEDAAQAIGSEYKNKKIGSFDHTTTFSFTAAKIITTVEGGCVSTGDKNIYEKLRQIRNFGRAGDGQYIHRLNSVNFRFNDIHAALGIKQLEKINEFIKRRIEIANRYEKNIKNLTFQVVPEYTTTHSHMLFFAFAKDNQMKEKYLNFLRQNGIDARLPYHPIHRQPCNSELADSNCPGADEIFEKALTLPIYNNMTLDECDLVIDYCNQVEEK